MGSRKSDPLSQVAKLLLESSGQTENDEGWGTGTTPTSNGSAGKESIGLGARKLTDPEASDPSTIPCCSCPPPRGSVPSAERRQRRGEAATVMRPKPEESCLAMMVVEDPNPRKMLRKL